MQNVLLVRFYVLMENLTTISFVYFVQELKGKNNSQNIKITKP